jgi:hypothetical protein
VAPRLLVPAVALVLVLTVWGWAAERLVVVVEDWAAHAPGARGVPEGWKAQTWGRPAYDLTVVEHNPEKVLHLRSQRDSSTITRAVKVDVRRTPILEWRWKAVRLPAGGDARHFGADDQAVQLYLIWQRTHPAPRILGYIWDTSAPAGSVIESQKSALVTYIVVRSGTGDVGRWVHETRDVYADYRRIYEEEPDELEAVSIAIDSDDTRSEAEAYVGAIRFRAR